MKQEFTQNMAKTTEYLYKQGAFLTVKDKQGRVNTMTIGWGSIGYMWLKPVFMIMVRKSRYTYELIENAESFTVSVPYSDKMKKALSICGSKSGRDVDKCSNADISFISSNTVDSPIVAGCNMYYDCKILFKQDMDKNMLLPEINKTMYGDNNYHKLYYGEIADCYEEK